jgi:hypothetical protein
MPNKVGLFLRISTPNGHRRYVKAISSSNGRLRPLWALVNAKREHHPEGVTDKLIEHAGVQAEALLSQAETANIRARVTTIAAEAASANIEMFVNKERARLRIELDDLPRPLLPGVLQVRYSVTIYGK